MLGGSWHCPAKASRPLSCCLLHPLSNGWPVLPARPQWESFDKLRQRVEREWAALPPAADVLAAPLREKRAAVAARLGVQGQVLG